jgi:predicted nuclease of predicted toxin-antitoxin system
VIKIIVDMNLPPRWVTVLKNEGWDAVHWSSIGNPGATDTNIMRYAKDDGYAVLTHDLDFGAILAATGWETPSVIQVRTQDVFPQAIGHLVIAAIKQFSDEIKKGVLISIDKNRSRARILPIE